MKRNRKIAALVIFALMIGQTVPAFAQDGDIWEKTGSGIETKVSSARKLLLGADMRLYKKVILKPNLFLYEIGGKLYEVDALNSEFTKDKKNYVNNLVQRHIGKPVEEQGTLEILTIE